MEPREVLTEAAKAVDEAKIPPELRVVAFEKAFDLIVGNRLPGADKRDATASNGAEFHSSSPSHSIIAKIASRLKLDESVVREVFDIEDDRPNLIVSSSKLPDDKRAASKEIALLIAAARQAADMEEYTLLTDIRPVAEHFGKYDSNFSTSINQMDDVVIFRERDKSRAMRLRQTGWEQASALVARMGGIES